VLAVAVALNGGAIGPSMVGSLTPSGAERIFGHFVTMTCFTVLGAV